jgi:hypothetical protein
MRSILQNEASFEGKTLETLRRRQMVLRLKIVTARFQEHRHECLCYKEPSTSVSNRGPSNDILSNNPRNSATESIPAALTSFWDASGQ